MREPAPFPRWTEYVTPEEYAREYNPTVVEPPRVVSWSGPIKPFDVHWVDPLPALRRAVEAAEQTLRVRRGTRDRRAQRHAEAHADVSRALDALKVAEEALRQAEQLEAAKRPSRSVRAPVDESDVIWARTMVGAEGRTDRVIAGCSRYPTLLENRAEVLRMLHAAGAVK